MEECEGLGGGGGGGGGEEENPIIFHDGPLQTLNVLSFKKKNTHTNIFQFLLWLRRQEFKKN